MDLDRVDIKLFVRNPDAVRWADLTGIFTRWRDEDRERWLDIADYVHLEDGPGLLLVGKDLHVSMDARHGRPGLLYSRREPLEGTTRKRIAEALRETVAFAAKLEREDGVDARFGTDLIDFIVNDRVQFPNEEQTYEGLRGDLEDALSEVFGGKPADMSRDPDPRQRLTVHVRVGSDRPVGQVLDDLGVKV